MECQSDTLHAMIEGRVQGVGFRYFVQDAAESLSITGWVRNRENGQVEVCAEGQHEHLEKFIQLLERGPRAAAVTSVTIEWQSASGKYKHFSILPTDW